MTEYDVEKLLAIPDKVVVWTAQPSNEANSDMTTDLKAAFDKALDTADPSLVSQMRFLETSMGMVVQGMSDEARVQAQQNFYSTQLGQLEQISEIEMEF